jgi:hypothetical protein
LEGHPLQIPTMKDMVKNYLQTLNPDLAVEWHPTRNGQLTPSDVTPGSKRKVWWTCSRGHEWQARVNERSGGTGCPYCAGRLACGDNCLATVNPTLANEWHPNRNEGLTPRDVVPGTSKKVWWMCGKGHEWQATINQRSSGAGCPYCAGRLACEDNCLETVNPTLANEWHPNRNGGLTPRDVVPGTSKKVWWMCGKGHEWQATISHRGGGTGCPYCAGRLACEDNCLETVNPALAKEWHPTKNGQLTPRDVTAGGSKKVWWTCNRGHEWQTTINHRSGGAGCPYCAGRLACEDNCLETVNPTLANEWHPNRNGGLTPRGVVPGTSKKVWWMCDKGHEWQATINHRSGGTGCPYCAGRLACKDNCLETVNPALAKEWHPTKNGQLTPHDVTTGTHEKVWWVCNRGHEWEARVNERSDGRGCPYCAGRRVCEDNCLQTVNSALASQWHLARNGNLTAKDVTLGSNRKVWWMCDKGHEWQATTNNRSGGTGCPYCAGRRVCEDNCLETVNPALAKEWHPTKNGQLTPRDVTAGTHEKVWWVCNRGHEWEAAIYSRVAGSGCPYCSNRAVCEDNCLQTLNPLLAKEWHPTRNGTLTPLDVVTGSGKKVWWMCDKGHEWQAPVRRRAWQPGCPFCSREKVRPQVLAKPKRLPR